MKTMNKRLAALGIAATLSAGGAHASVVIGSTRVVYPLDEREVAVKLTNDSANPSLVQVWMDDGNADQKPADSHAPFVVTPPIFRMDPNKSQTLRMMYDGAALPRDRESVYWLDVLDVPPKADAEAGSNTLQFAYRTRIKVFARPRDLPGTPDDAPRRLGWKAVPAPQGQGQAQALAVSNPTPYYVSFSAISVAAEDRQYSNEKGGMVAPKSQGVIDMPHMNGVRSGTVHFTAINDYGGAIEGDATLAP